MTVVQAMVNDCGLGNLLMTVVYAMINDCGLGQIFCSIKEFC